MSSRICIQTSSRREGTIETPRQRLAANDRCEPYFEAAGQIFDYLEWIATVTTHIPENGAQLVHYYGAYSNAHRGKIAKLGDSAVATTHCKQEAES